MRVYEIIPGLYTRGRFTELPLAAKLKGLEALGVRTVICLLPRADLSLFGRVNYIHTPLSDGRRIDVPRVLSVVQQVIMELRHDRRVLVHCNAGRNRAGLVAALVVRELRGCSGREALELVRARRPRAVANRHFEEFLLGLPAARPAAAPQR